MLCAFQKNVLEKFQSSGIPLEESNKFLDDIFGKSVGGVKVEGLVDTSSLKDSDTKLNALEEIVNYHMLVKGVLNSLIISCVFRLM